MFESRLIDRFSRTHPALVPALFVPAIALLTWHGLAAGVGTAAAFTLGAAGLFAWTFAEYWLHRTFFHWIPNDTWGPRMHFLAHGVHHAWPRDRYRLVMPLAVSFSLFWLVLGVFLVLLGTQAFLFHAGFVMGYLLYDMGHYYMHHFSPRTRWMRALRRHHLAHHGPKYDNLKFGVSTTLWDHVFRTYEVR